MILPRLYGNSHQKKHTITELFVVIAIIGIATGLILTIVDVNEYLAQSRDSRRIAVMLQLQTALAGAVSRGQIELVDTTSCADCDSILGTYNVNGSGYIKFENLDRGLKDFVQLLPEDPINEGELKYSYYSDGEYFELNAVMESEKYAPNAEKDGGNDPNVYERGWDLELN